MTDPPLRRGDLVGTEIRGRRVLAAVVGQTGSRVLTRDADGADRVLRSADVERIGPLPQVGERHPGEVLAALGDRLRDARDELDAAVGGSVGPVNVDDARGLCLRAEAWLDTQWSVDGEHLRSRHHEPPPSGDSGADALVARCRGLDEPAPADVVDALVARVLRTADDATRRRADEITDAMKRVGVALPATAADAAHAALQGAGLWETRFDVEVRAAGIPLAFSHEVEAAAADAAERVTEVAADMPDVAVGEVFTIDAADTFDFDDAFSAAVRGDGALELAVHIAHPSAVIALDDPLEAVARERGSSLYLPVDDVPMLPDVLSERGLSLIAGAPRPTLTVRAVVMSDGELTERTLELGRVTVAANLDHAAATERIESGDPTWSRLDRWWRDARARRQAAGAMHAALPRARVAVGADGELRLSRRHRDAPSERLVEELMIFFNEAVALTCAERGWPCPYRTQPSPSEPNKARRWAEHDDPILGGFKLIRHLSAASISQAPAPHAGVGVSHYAQASSPLRRYSDLLLHEVVRRGLAGDPMPPTDDLWRRWTEGDDAGSRAVKAMRRSHHHWRLRWLAGREGQRLEAAVLDDVGAGAKAKGVLLEPMLNVSWRTQEALRAGDRVALCVDAVAPFSRRVDVSPATA